MSDEETPHTIQADDERKEFWREEHDKLEAWQAQRLREASDAVRALPGGDGIDFNDPDSVLAFLEPLDEKTRRRLGASLDTLHSDAGSSRDRPDHPMYQRWGWWVGMWVISLGAGAPGSAPRWGDCLDAAREQEGATFDVLLRSLKLRPPSVRSTLVRAILGSGYLELGRVALVDAAVNTGIVDRPESVRYRAGFVLGAAAFWDQDWWWATPSTRAADVLEALRDPEVATTLKVAKYRVPPVADLVNSGRLPRIALADACLVVLSQSLEPNAATLPRNVLEALDLSEAELGELAGAVIRVISHGDPQSALLALSWVRAFSATFRPHSHTLREALGAVAQAGTKASAEVALSCAVDNLDELDVARVLIAALEHRHDAIARRAVTALTRMDREDWPEDVQQALVAAASELPAALRPQAQSLVPAQAVSRGGSPAPAPAPTPAPPAARTPAPRKRVEGCVSVEQLAVGILRYCNRDWNLIHVARLLDGYSQWRPSDLGPARVTELKQAVQASHGDLSRLPGAFGEGSPQSALFSWLWGRASFASIEELADGIDDFLGSSVDAATWSKIVDGTERWEVRELEPERTRRLRESLARAADDPPGLDAESWKRGSELIQAWLTDRFRSRRLTSVRRLPEASTRGGIATTEGHALVARDGQIPIGLRFGALLDGRCDETNVLSGAPRRPSLDLPSWSTGHIDPTDLLDRMELLEAGGEFSVGEYEIWHALLRLDLALVDAACITRAGALRSEVGRVVADVMAGTPGSPLAEQILRVRETHIDGVSWAGADVEAPWPPGGGHVNSLQVTRFHIQSPTGTSWTVGVTGGWTRRNFDPALAGCDDIVQGRSYLDWTALTLTSQRGLHAAAALVEPDDLRHLPYTPGGQIAALEAFMGRGKEWGPMDAHLLARALGLGSASDAAAEIIDFLPTVIEDGIPARMVGAQSAVRANGGRLGLDKAGRRVGVYATDPALAWWVADWCQGVVESLEGAPKGVIEVLRAWETAAATTGATRLDGNTVDALKRLTSGSSQRALAAKRILSRATP